MSKMLDITSKRLDITDPPSWSHKVYIIKHLLDIIMQDIARIRHDNLCDFHDRSGPSIIKHIILQANLGEPLSNMENYIC